jgi:hypothetical protein
MPLDEFRELAFNASKPLLIKTPVHTDASPADPSKTSMPAMKKWFAPNSSGTMKLNATYLEPYSDTTLPYELVRPSSSSSPSEPELEFRRFDAPLSLFLTAVSLPCSSSARPQLYISQCPLSSLPSSLQDDFPVPRLVRESGRGDVYDSSLWLGVPPTYTPLHRDPNPNLFVQLCGRKAIRLMRPGEGGRLFEGVRRRAYNMSGGTGSAGMDTGGRLRGEEMMRGVERRVLQEAVWGAEDDKEGGEGGWQGEMWEARLAPGDALFIPLGWWHSVRSVGEEGVNASVNWWFR